MTCNSLPRLLLTSAFLVFGLSSIGISTASAAVQDRIAAQVGASTSAIPNSVHPKAQAASDLGPAPGNTKLGMSIRFNMTASQEASLDQLLADQQNPASPSYHQWLTPAQYAAQFGLSSNDLAKISGWLASQGFTVTGVANGGTFISFDGTVAQAQTAFATSIHNVSVNGETHFANVTNVFVPAAFGGVIAAVTGLHNFRLQPHIHASIAKPEFTSSVSGNHYVAPGDIYSIYNVTPLLAAGVTGTGETIAVTGQVDIFPADVVAFRTASGLNPSTVPTTVHEGGDPGPPVCNTCTTGANEGDLAESSIDVEWSGAMAPAASILFVNGPHVMANAMTQALDQNLAPIITTSYGLCEAGWGTTELLTLQYLFKQANVQGQTVLAAAADQGATDCDAGPSAAEGLAVDFPGSSPNVTSVGGTMFNEGTATGATNYWLGTDGTITAGAAVPAATYSAIGYIPEAVWNDSGYGAYGGGGGGASNYFIKPTWQVGTGVPNDAARDVPDLALNASDAHDSLLFCVNVALGDSCGSGFRQSTTSTALDAEGGTSYDSQIMGGLFALIEQQNGGTRIGNANPTIYALANNSKYYVAGQNTSTNSTVVFNDVTTGNNSMLCNLGTPNCGNGGVEGFNAGNGFDLASGWGSVNVTNLAKDWTLVTPLGIGSLGNYISSTALTASPSTAAVGATVTLTATVTGAGATTPSGTVQFLANNVALGSPVPVSGSALTATATYAWITSCSALGQQVMTASYSGDANYQGSRGPLLTAGGAAETASGSSITSPVEVVVSSTTCPNFALSGSSTTVTVAAGGTIPAVTITVTPSNNFTGTVTFTAEATSTSGYSPTLTFTPASVSITSSAAATTSLAFTGITASLHLPGAPGRVDSGIEVAQKSSGRTPWYAAGSGVTIASLLLLALPRRRRMGGLLLVVLAVGLIGGATGCGSSQSGPPTTTITTSTNPYVGTYYVYIVGTYTSSTTGLVTQQSTEVTYLIN